MLLYEFIHFLLVERYRLYLRVLFVVVELDPLLGTQGITHEKKKKTKTWLLGLRSGQGTSIAFVFLFLSNP